jgi:hypothetical protein
VRGSDYYCLRNPYTTTITISHDHEHVASRRSLPSNLLATTDLSIEARNAMTTDKSTIMYGDNQDEDDLIAGSLFIDENEKTNDAQREYR